MITDKFGQMVYDQDEVFDILMHDINPANPEYRPGPFLVDGKTIDIDSVNTVAQYTALTKHLDSNQSIADFDKAHQSKWFMPASYKEMDIAAYILEQCNTQAELQRCGEELLMFQERDLFDLLRYVKYLVDVMTLNSVIWGVGRGSSVSSYVLYKLKIHRIDSMYYKLDVAEFLR